MLITSCGMLPLAARKINNPVKPRVIRDLIANNFESLSISFSFTINTPYTKARSLMFTAATTIPK